MKLYIIFMIYIAFHFTEIKSQFDPGARQIALAHSNLAVSNSIFSLYNNPAGNADSNGTQIGIYYTPNVFGLEELANGAIGYSQPTDFGIIGMVYSFYGYELYRQSKFILGYSNNIGARFSIGISFLYQTLRIKKYGSDTGFNLILGGIIKFGGNYFIGFALHNPLRVPKSQLPFPLKYYLGVTSKPHENAEISISILKEIDFPVSLRLGVEYKIVKFLSIQFGIKNKPNIYGGGITIKEGMIELSYSAANHNILGLSHQGDLIFHF